MIYLLTLCLFVVIAWLFVNALNEKRWVDAHSHDEIVAADPGIVPEEVRRLGARVRERSVETAHRLRDRAADENDSLGRVVHRTREIGDRTARRSAELGRTTVERSRPVVNRGAELGRTAMARGGEVGRDLVERSRPAVQKAVGKGKELGDRVRNRSDKRV